MLNISIGKIGIIMNVVFARLHLERWGSTGELRCYKQKVFNSGKWLKKIRHGKKLRDKNLAKKN